MALDQGRPRFVTMLAESNEGAGWRPTKSTSGAVFDVASNAPVTRGLAMPHSPRWHEQQLWVLNSGVGTLEVVDLASGRRNAVASMPGYTRGLAFDGPFAFIGLSRIRETAVFGGLPIAEKRSELKCGIGVVDLRSGRPVASLEFESGVEEIFDVQVVPGCRCVAICGPRPDQDDAKDIWVVPRPDQTPVVANARSSGAPTDQLVREWVERARVLQGERKMGDALELLQHAANARPMSAPIWNTFGNALQDAGQQEQALECYRRSAIADPRFGPGLQNLGYVLVARGQTDEGIAHLKQAQRVAPNEVNHVLIATALPVVYESLDDARARRAHLVRLVQRLVDEGATIDTANQLIPTNFFAVYQGENDRDLHANLGRIYRGLDVCRRRPGAEPRARRRVGFLSAYFRDHTIGRLNLGRIQKLPRDRFEVVVLSVGKHDDPMAVEFARAGENYLAVPRQIGAARQMIADQDLDVLFFTDVGMDALTYTLAFSRMAPVQCTTWGHPVTTGSPAMDYFISSRLLEGPEADSHYTERLVRLPSLGTYYYRPKIIERRKTHRDFGLDAGRRIYLCPQTLFKIHPEFDSILKSILERDTGAELILIEGRTANWTELLKERFARAMPQVAGRIRWLPAQQNQDFLQLMSLADVILDPIYFGGGNTSYEAIAVSTPVVTLPGKYLRSRITRALYEKMGLFSPGSGDDEVARSLVLATNDDYAAAAVAIANSNAGSVARNWIQMNSPKLFEDDQEVRDLAEFLGRAACATPGKK
jgi:predicted O-linked N-acetylglucosamine transferase (SPINDLY family)